MVPIDKIDIISEVLKNSSWLPEHYHDRIIDYSSLSSEYIATHIKYDFSLLGYYNFDKVDVYKLCIYSDRNKPVIYIPFGDYIMFDKDLENYKKYTTYQPNFKSLYCYWDLFIPFFDNKWQVE